MGKDFHKMALDECINIRDKKIQNWATIKYIPPSKCFHLRKNPSNFARITGCAICFDLKGYSKENQITIESYLVMSMN